jgi:hypothetical protein
MTRRKRDDELAALRAENARLKALLGQQEAAPEQRAPRYMPIPGAVPEELIPVEMAEDVLPADVAAAPTPAKHPKQPPSQPQQPKGVAGWAFALWMLGVLGVLLYIVAWPTVLVFGSYASWSPPWIGALGVLILALIVVFAVLKNKRDHYKESERAALAQQRELKRQQRERQRDQKRLERAQQQEQARIARLQQREQAKAAKAAAPKAPRERPHRRITHKLRVPITQKLDPDDAP